MNPDYRNLDYTNSPLKVGTPVRVAVTHHGDTWDSVITAVNFAMAGPYRPYYMVRGGTGWYYHTQVEALPAGPGEGE